MSISSSVRPTVFLSYSHKDEVWKERLKDHLKVLEEEDALVVWDDRKINAGETWYDEIRNAMDKAEVAVCLISAHFLSSKFCVKEEVPYLLERRTREGLIFLPILVGNCFWEPVRWLSSVQMLPRDGKAVEDLDESGRNKAFREVARQIYEQTRELVPTRSLGTSFGVEAEVSTVRVETGRLPVTGAELFGRQSELSWLDRLWDEGQVRVASLVAWGGVGKSTLVNKWLESLAAEDYRGARRVYGWSFFSQGAGDRVTSADEFIHHALGWFGDPDPAAGSPWAKGERLAELIRREKTLLILDGMEPLQSNYEGERGQIKDPALTTLLAELARPSEEAWGLCLVTSRERVADLHRFHETVAHKDLEQISAEAGRALLRVGGVRGTDAELEEASRAFGNHALAVNLLAAFLKDVPGHPAKAAFEIPDLDLRDEEGGHPRRMMEAFAQRFGPGPELELLQVLGLFDRPAPKRAIDALRAEPVIRGWTEHLTRLSESGWLRLVERLRGLQLVARGESCASEDLDAHPLVREHFVRKSRAANVAGWLEGNKRLYDFYKAEADEFPADREGMFYLYSAMKHACLAELHSEALNDVFWPRILRKEGYFSAKKLGAFSADLAALSLFFSHPWRKTVDGLVPHDQAFLFGAAGACLHALGRLREAVEPIRIGVEERLRQRDWKNAALELAQLGESYLLLGNISSAVELFRQSVDVADFSHDLLARMSARAELARALHQIGRLREAGAVFEAAESLQAQADPENPFLRSYLGYLYCDFLLDQGKHSAVEHRARRNKEWAHRVGASPFSVGFEFLCLGRALKAKAPDEGDHIYIEAAECLRGAVEAMREANQLDRITLALLFRAELHRSTGQYGFARRDLDDALRLVQRHEIRLQEADYHLGFTRLHLAEGDRARARESLACARRMIAEMGYHRRDREVAELECLLVNGEARL